MFWHNWEPTLEEILSDPIVEAVMQADDVDPNELDAMLGDIASRLRAADGNTCVPAGTAEPCCQQNAMS
jgi:hypothetical protein